MSTDLLSIGAFARLCRLSVKQLRHYDELGLLPPKRVDAATGYRYYGRDQVRDAMAIALLRGFDVPLSSIARMLGGDRGVQDAVLSAEQRRLEERIAAQRRAWQALERLVAEGLLHQEVALSREPERRLLVCSAECAPEEIGAAMGRCVEQVTAAAAGLEWSPPLWGRFPVDLRERVAVAVGVAAPTAAPVPGTRVEHLPGGLAATALHTGPYEQLFLTYQAVFAWVHERALRPRGSVYEEYLDDPRTTDPAGLRTRIVVPLHEEE